MTHTQDIPRVASPDGVSAARPQRQKKIRDWLVPLRVNVWLQAAILLTLLGPVLGWAFHTALSSHHFPVGLLVGLDTAWQLPLVVASLLFLSTTCGHGTLTAYRRTRDHILATGDLDPKFQQRYTRSLYCARAAAWESGLHGSLLPRLANPWLPI